MLKSCFTLSHTQSRKPMKMTISRDNELDLSQPVAELAERVGMAELHTDLLSRLKEMV